MVRRLTPFSTMIAPVARPAWPCASSHSKVIAIALAAAALAGDTKTS